MAATMTRPSRRAASVVPPHSTDMERRLIGAALTWPDQVLPVDLSPDDFYDPQAADIWQRILERVDLGQRVEASIVAGSDARRRAWIMDATIDVVDAGGYRNAKAWAEQLRLLSFGRVVLPTVVAATQAIIVGDIAEGRLLILAAADALGEM